MLAMSCPRTALILSLFLALSLTAPSSRASDIEQGYQAYQAGDYQQAFTLWQPLAEQGDAEAQFYLGLLYRNGEGVEKDDRTALMWFTESAKQGYLNAQYNTGIMYMEGRGVAVSKIDAFKWWELAAQRGHAPSQYNLGVLYAYGIATGKDVAKAIDLWQRAAAQGNAEARAVLHRVYSEGMFGEPLDKAKSEQWSE